MKPPPPPLLLVPLLEISAFLFYFAYFMFILVCFQLPTTTTCLRWLSFFCLFVCVSPFEFIHDFIRMSLSLKTTKIEFDRHFSFLFRFYFDRISDFDFLFFFSSSFFCQRKFIHFFFLIFKRNLNSFFQFEKKKKKWCWFDFCCFLSKKRAMVSPAETIVRLFYDLRFFLILLLQSGPFLSRFRSCLVLGSPTRR